MLLLASRKEEEWSFPALSGILLAFSDPATPTLTAT